MGYMHVSVCTRAHSDRNPSINRLSANTSNICHNWITSATKLWLWCPLQVPSRLDHKPENGCKMKSGSHWCFACAFRQIVENSVCALRNLSYRLEVEMPSSRLLGNQELDSLLGFSPAKELDYLCLGKKRRGRKRGGWPVDKVRGSWKSKRTQKI